MPAVAAAGLAAALFLAPSNAVPPNGGGSTAVVPSVLPSTGVPSAAGSPSATAGRRTVPPVAAAPTAVSIDAADLKVRVLPLTPSADELASESLVPPLTLDAYWLTSYGVPGAGSTNTTYIVGHSWDGRDAPFNRLSDESLVGKAVTVTTAKGTLKYVVDSVTTHDKNTLKDSDIWNVVPNRVVLISCYTEDPWGKNVVVTASPAP
ncbi:class F sortase [Arthrobacter sp. NPDC056727]|uniref:class F sortase n=1 Tax=Arthrobacter sp. NPDC056727 TaxID=3345927 RepID=UPI00366D420D